jgi:hypothetical protein
MKVISALQGFSILRLSPDDVAPEGGVIIQRVVEAVATHFKFSSRPELPQIPQNLLFQALGTNPLLFQNGEFLDNQDIISISTLSLYANGAVVASQSTERSDAVLDELIRVLDEELKFKIGNGEQNRSHASGIVVEFAVNLEKQISGLSKLQSMIAGQLKEFAKITIPFELKRLTFGTEANRVNDPLDVERSIDFSIERRANSPFSSNRFFCVAPLTTRAHISALEAIERAFQD